MTSPIYSPLKLGDRLLVGDEFRKHENKVWRPIPVSFFGTFITPRRNKIAEYRRQTRPVFGFKVENPSVFA